MKDRELVNSAQPGSGERSGIKVPDKPGRVCLLVLGAHRSGTSALTRVLNLHGADLPSDLLAPVQENNERGFWESRRLMIANEEMLRHFTTGWGSTLDIAKEKRKEQVENQFVSTLLRYFEEDFSQSSLFVIKDPRISRLGEYWMRALRDFGAEIKVIISLRSPLDVAASLHLRDGLPNAISYIVWLRYMLDAWHWSSTLPRTVVAFPDLMANWGKAIQKIEKDLDLSWPTPSSRVAEQVNAFLSRDLVHHSSSEAEIEQRETLPAWTREAYSVLLEISRYGETSKRSNVLSRLRREIDKADENLRYVLSAFEQAIEDAANRLGEVSENKKQLENFLVEAAEAERRLKEEYDAQLKEKNRLTVSMEKERKLRLAAEEHLANANITIESQRKETLRNEAELWIARNRLRRIQARLDVSRRDRLRLGGRVRPKSQRISPPPIRFLKFLLSGALREIEDASIITSSGLFDPEFYLSRYPDVDELGSDPLEHFVRYGAAEKRSPCFWFDTPYYLRKNPDVAAAQINPLVHYLRYGARERRDPHPAFLTRYYLERTGADEEVNPLVHFLSIGKPGEVSPCPIFDLVHYRSLRKTERITYVSLQGYLESGWIYGLDPHPLFETTFYLDQNPDVRRTGQCPLLHFLEMGGVEGRNPSPYFDCKYYVSENPDLKRSGINPLVHYLTIGYKEGRNPNRLFDTDWYLAQNPDVHGAGINPLVHFLRHGAADSRDPHPDFDSVAYQAEKSEIGKSGAALFAHALQHVEQFKKFAGNAFEKVLPGDAGEDTGDGLRSGPYEFWCRLNRAGPNRLYSQALGAGASLWVKGVKVGSPADFQVLLEMVDCVSFDLFDTLVERAVSEPSDVFRIVGLTAPDVFGDYEGFARARISAETAARSKIDCEEVTLDEIMSELQQAYNLPRDQIDALRRTELEMERRVICARPDGKALFDATVQAGRHINVLTDTYLPQAFIEEVLEDCGYSGFDSLYVSSTLRETKHHGSLFDRWLERERFTPCKVLHVGDNAHSDVEVPRARGMLTYQVKKSIDQLLSDPKNARVWTASRLRQLPGRMVAGVIARRYSQISAPTSVNSQYKGSPYLLGYAALGPLLLGFTQFLVRFARRRGTSMFCFLSRDGYVLKAAYDLVAAVIDDLPKSVYLGASRALASSAAADSLDRILEIAAVDHHPMSIGDMLRHRFGFSEADVESISETAFERYGLTGPGHIVTRDNAVKRSFLEAIAPQIIRLCSLRAARYTAYLRSVDIDYSTAALVDIGYAASSQRVVSRLLNTSVEGAYLITSERASVLESEYLRAEGWMGNCVPLDNQFFHHVQNWEMFLSASHGTAVDVGQDDSERCRLRLDKNMFDESIRANLAVVHRGALDFVGNFLEKHGVDFETIELDPELCSAPLSHFFSSPDAEDCAAFSGALFEDLFGADTRLLMVQCQRKVLEIPNFSKQIVWREGSVAVAERTELATPFYPVSPVSIARSQGVLAQAPAFIDEIDGLEIRPSWRSKAYRAVFDDDGWPVATTAQIAIRLVLPVTRIDDDTRAVIASYRQQCFGGLSLVVAYFDSVAPEDLNSALDNVRADKIGVSSWKEVLDAALGFEECWVVLNDGYTVLDPAFTAEVTYLLRSTPAADIIVVDDDRIDSKGKPANPYFKPEWSPELLLSTDYFGGTFVVRSSLLRGIETRSSSGSAWVWEIALSLTKSTDRVSRIPRVLAHRSSSAFIAELPQARVDSQKAVAGRFQEIGLDVEVVLPDWAAGSDRLACQPRFPDDGPFVAIIIPTRNQGAVVRRCIDSLRRTTYKNYRIYLVDNESDEPDSLEYFDSLEADGVRVLRIGNPSGEFSYSYVNNRAVEQTEGEEYLLFLNNDTEVIEPRWLSQMAGWQQLPDVGSVGARLLFPDGTIQHAGITHRLLYKALPAPSFKCLPGDEGGYQDWVFLARDSAAQTAACLLTPRTVFIEHGMFDESAFSVAYNDCDYGFKLTKAGLRNVYCPDAVLYHHEGLSRGVGRGNDKPEEEAEFVRKYAGWTDPYFNPNLALGRTDFAIRPTAPITTPVPRLRLAVATHNLEHEGAPRVLMEIVLGLKNTGMAEIVVLSGLDGPLRSIFEEHGCRVEIVPGSGNLFRSDHSGMDSLSNVSIRLAELRIDMVLANTVLSWWAVEAATLVRIPSIWIIHESEPPFTHLAQHGDDCARRGRNALAWPYRVVFVSYATRDVFADLETTCNFEVLHNGFDEKKLMDLVRGWKKQDVRRNLELPVDAVVGLLPGSVCERKSQLDLVHAVRLVDIDIVRKMSLVILGDRPNEYSADLHAAISNLDPVRKKAFKVLPYAPGAEKYFYAADFMISTSRIEAFPRVIQEAMCFSLPMVVAPVYGVVEQVQDEVSALFFPPGDPVKLASQLERVVVDPRLRQKLGENARVTLKRFPTNTEMTENYARIIREAWLSRQ